MLLGDSAGHAVKLHFTNTVTGHIYTLLAS